MREFRHRALGLATGMAVAAWAFAAGPAEAAIMGYTDEAAFQSAVSAAGFSATTLDFESLAAGNAMAFGDLIFDGDTLEGITFNYPVLAGFGVTMEVRDDDDTTSGQNSLGTDDGGVFQDGDTFEPTFAPVNAIGMFFITADPMFDGDITLSAGGGSVDLLAGGGTLLPDGGEAFFLGLIDDMASFASASIVADSGDPFAPVFTFTVDDIATASASGGVGPGPGPGPNPIPVSEPASLPLLTLGLIGLWAVGRRRRHAA